MLPDMDEPKARSEVEQMLTHITGWTRTQWLTSLVDEMPPAAVDALGDLVIARASGRPLQYLLGEAHFYGHTFVVRPGCLIPRPETEELVARAVDWMGGRPFRVIDLGTGSGCIALSIALACPASTVTGIDVSAEALEIARENDRRLNAGVVFHLVDGLDVLRRMAASDVVELAGVCLERPTVLISNPPYIPSDEVDTLAPDVRDHEPLLALDGGSDGLDIYKAIVAIGPAFFAEGSAACLFEVGAGQAEIVADLFRCSPDWDGWSFTVYNDLRGIGRVVVGIR